MYKMIRRDIEDSLKLLDVLLVSEGDALEIQEHFDKKYPDEFAIKYIEGYGIRIVPRATTHNFVSMYNLAPKRSC